MSAKVLFEPASIAIVGASDKPSPGRNVALSLQRFGFPNPVYAVNPKYQKVAGFDCFGSLADLPKVPELAVFCVGHERAVAAIEEAARLGVKGAVIFDGGFAERGGEGIRRQSRIAEICREANIALCGPNCMGVMSPARHLSTYLLEVRNPKALTGNVGLVSQSGAICICLLTDVRRFGFSHVVSSGNEAVTTCADYLEYLVEDSATSIIGCFIEAVRDPERFVAALDRAAEKGKPVVVLKVGKSARTQHAIVSHTGGMAGEARVFSEVLRAHRAIEVPDLTTFTEVISAYQGVQKPTGRRIAAVMSSGGLAELVLDIGEAGAIELPPLSSADKEKARAVVGSLTGDGNPFDAWGNGNFKDNFRFALQMFDQSDDHDNIVFVRDSVDDPPADNAEREVEYLGIFADMASRSRKPHFLLHTRPGSMAGANVAAMRAAGIPVIGGIQQGLFAIDRLARAKQPPLPLRRMGISSTQAKSVLLDKTRATINEYDAKRILAANGVTVPQEVLAETLTDAKQAAAKIGYPIVLKVASDSIPHKSEYGLVKVGIADENELSAVWERMNKTVQQDLPSARVQGYLVQQMIKGEVEVFAGVKRDVEFGHVFVVGFGGVFIELLEDFAIRPLPLREGDAAVMIAELRGARLLKGYRGKPPLDVDSLIRCLDHIADFAFAERQHIAEIDVNPIVVLEGGCFALDAVIVPNREDASQ
jgi:acetate---CoA ligase (ADP-forming)